MDLDTIGAIYRRMGAEAFDTESRGWGIYRVKVKIARSGYTKPANPEDHATYLDLMWALEMIKECAEANRTGGPMRQVNRADAKGWGIKDGLPKVRS